MIIIEPALVERPAVDYIAKPVVVTMDTIDAAINEALAEVQAWCASAAVEPAGAPIVRYRVIDMERELLIEVGVPVAGRVSVPDGMIADSLPAGTYGSATFRNWDEGVAGNGALIDWAVENGIVWDVRETDAGDAFASRVEVLRGDPNGSDDPQKWECEVAIMVARE